MRRSGVEQLSAEVPDAILERRRGFFGEAADPELEDVAIADRYLDAGATHLIVMTGHPFDLAPVEALVARRDN